MTHFDFEKPLVELESRIRALREALAGQETSDEHIAELEVRAERLQREIYGHLEPWQKVQLSRHPARPYFLDYAESLFEDFVELHGDRAYRDDAAIVAGFARFRGRPVAVVGHQKGRGTREKVARNFGMAHPEGYRKAMRVMQLASRFGRPIFTFIDTPGAYPGIGAEERGQSEAIGRSLLEMAALEVPVIATVLGEGGSGGALALGVANRVLMFEFSTYSVITPEGCASILWRDGGMAPEAAEQLKLLSPDARRLNIVDEIIEEPLGGAHRDPSFATRTLGEALERHLGELSVMTRDALLADRHRKFRAMGEIVE
jgi:acetyl-CoA carboxylase carboxyl transferase subunit alpha